MLGATDFFQGSKFFRGPHFLGFEKMFRKFCFGSIILGSHSILGDANFWGYNIFWGSINLGSKNVDIFLQVINILGEIFWVSTQIGGSQICGGQILCGVQII